MPHWKVQFMDCMPVDVYKRQVFNHQTNVDINNRIVCFDIKELGKQLKKIGMLVIQDRFNDGMISRTDLLMISTRMKEAELQYICLLYTSRCV